LSGTNSTNFDILGTITTYRTARRNLRLILSISSDIGTALAKDWTNAGFEVAGTYRNWSKNCEILRDLGIQLIHCDFTDKKSIDLAISKTVQIPLWNVIVLAAGDQNPIGLFKDVTFDDWEKSIDGNFTGMLRFLHHCLGFQSSIETRSVIFFAGGATNSATERYSAYTISKIASIKICELLDFEMQDTKFTILGPGWVKTKIHQSTILEPINSGQNFERTKNMLQGNEMNSMSKVVECCNWVISQPKEIVGGRNFSVVYDNWGDPRLNIELSKDDDMYKLRRFKNMFFQEDRGPQK
jgi:NADP-dependent 3-hydroxy acid dehydrogenase YdfG